MMELAGGAPGALRKAMCVLLSQVASPHQLRVYGWVVVVNKTVGTGDVFAVFVR